jgi:hypothetical protein
MRFQVRPSHSEFGPTLFRVWDSHKGLFLAVFTREMLAKNACLRFEAAHLAELFAPAERAS